MDSVARLGRVNFKLLHTFVMVADHRSFRVAAQRAHRSPSAISMQIRQLEEQLGVPLFHRTTRSVEVTKEGVELLDYARRALNEFGMGLNKLEETSDLRRGKVTFSCSPSVAGSRLATALAAFELAHPSIEVFVKEVTSEGLFGSIAQREADFGIGPETNTGEFRFERLLEEDIFALIPRRYIAEDAESITLERLSAIPLLMLDAATALRGMIDAHFSRRGLKYRASYQFTQAQTLISMAEAGLGAAILPKISLPTVPARSTQALQITRPVLRRQLAIITAPGWLPSPAGRKMIEYIHRHIGGASL